jgi:flavin reductase (DIM6/NTAB) family NADH-FMN oxidoreductase RutF
MSGDVMDADAFDVLMSSLDPPLIVVTATVGDEHAGCLVGFHAQSSIDPRRYCVWLSKANHTYRVALGSTHLGIHFLTTADLSTAELFGTRTGDDVDKFAGTDYTTGAEGGVPVLSDCPHHLVVRRVALLDEGSDHVCIITEPVAVQSPGRYEPLRLSHAQHLVPGHDNEEHNGTQGDRRIETRLKASRT